MEAETLNDKLANVRTQAFFQALADTGAAVEAKALHVLNLYAEVETKNEDKALALVYTQEHKFSQVKA